MAAALAATRRMYSCSECREKGLQKLRFCEADAPYSVIEINGDEYKRCPVQYVTAESMEALNMYLFYNDGHLPRAGGFLDQPNKVMEQLQIIANQVAEEKERRRGKR